MPYIGRKALVALRPILLAVCAACALFIQCGRSGKENGTGKTIIQVKGSDTMVNVAQAWAEEYKNVEPSVEIEVSGGGSGVGIAALTRGAIDIATASRTMKPDEREQAKKNTGKEPTEYIVGYDALAVYVHKDNPLQEISLQQLSDIYEETGPVTKWSQLGVVIPVGKDKIIRISRQSSSGTYEFFREAVLKKRDFKLGSLDMNGSKEVVELVGNTKSSIGYSGMGYANSTVKMLKVAVAPGLPASPPTVENTQSKTYPLARSLQIYTLGEPSGAVKKYIGWIMSDAGQKILRECGYVPTLRADSTLVIQ